MSNLAGCRDKQDGCTKMKGAAKASYGADPTPEPGQADYEGFGVEQLFGVITKLARDNAATIARVEGAANKKVNTFAWSAPPVISPERDACTFTLDEEPTKELVGDLVKDWKGEVKLVDIFDMFNLKIEYACDRFAHMVRLNGAMLEAATRYNMFYDDDSKKGRVELKKFAANFAAIKAALGEVEALCRDRASRAVEMNRLLGEANALLATAARLGARFGPNPSVLLSTLGLSREDARTLLGWIPPPGAGANANPNWVPKYQATRDGFRAADFHAKCDGVRRLLVVIQSNTDHVFGAYTTEPFNNGGGGYTADATAFLFTLKNPHGVQPTKLPVIMSYHSQAMYSHPSYGPTYGNGHDIYIVDNCNTNGCQSSLGSGYTDPAGNRGAFFTGQPNGWTVKELLAFEV